MAMRVHDRHDLAGQLAEVVAQLIGQWVVGAGVDDGQASLAADRADRLVERLVAANPDAVADLAPGRGHVPSWSM
jgi:hypothetical protein